MMLYLDTSSLIKLYVKEQGSDEVKSFATKASTIITSIVTYAESRAAFAKQYRKGELSEEDYQDTKASFETDWKNYLIIALGEEIVKHAGDLTEKHGLRGFDAIHLASYLLIKRRIKSEIHFSSFDDQLNKAATKESL